MMEKPFKHPLARHATTTNLRPRDGTPQPMLLIVTTLELDEKAKGYSAKNVHRLHEAAQAYLTETTELTGYAIVTRPKDWAS